MAIRKKAKDFLDGLAGNLGEEEKAEKTLSDREMADIHRGSGLDVLNELEMVRCVSPHEVIAGDSLDKMRQALEGYKKAIRGAYTAVLDTREIDSNIIQMTVLLRNALEKEREDTALLICKYIGKAITEFRTDIQSSSEEEIQKILSKRIQQTRYMVTLGNLRTQVDDLQEEIQRYNGLQKTSEEKYDKAYAQLKENIEKYPQLENAVEEGIVSKTVVSAAAREMNAQKKQIVNLHNDIENIKSLKAKAKQHIQAYEANIGNLVKQLETTAVTLDEKVVDEILELQKIFERELREGEKEIDRLQEAAEDFQATLDAIFNSAKEMDRMIKTEIEFDRIQKEEKKQEEARAAAIRQKQEQELKQKQKQAQEQKQTQDQLFN